MSVLARALVFAIGHWLSADDNGFEAHSGSRSSESLSLERDDMEGEILLLL